MSLACVPLGPLAIVAGVMGLRQIRFAPALAGRVRAWAGIVTGVAGSLGLLFVSLVVYLAATKPPDVDSTPTSQPQGYWVDYQVPVEFIDSDGVPKMRLETRKRWVTGADAKATDRPANTMPLAPPKPAIDTNRSVSDSPASKPAVNDTQVGGEKPAAKPAPAAVPAKSKAKLSRSDDLFGD